MNIQTKTDSPDSPDSLDSPGLIDNQTIETELSLITIKYYKTVSLALFFIFVMFGVLNYFEFHGFDKKVIMTHDSLVISVLFLTHLLFKKPNKIRTFLQNSIGSTNSINLIVGICSTLILTNILLTLFFLPRPVTAVYLIMFFFGSSMLWFNYKWHTLMIISGIIPWFVIGFTHFETLQMASYSLSLLTSGFLSIIIIKIKRDSNISMIKLKYEVEKRNIELNRHLEEKNIEIRDRKKAEDEKTVLEEQLLQSQKMEAVGRLAGGVAHDINNMLAAITGTAQALINETKNDNAHYKDLTNILSACTRGKELTGNLLGFAQKGKYKREKIDINKLITAVHGFTSININKDILFETELKDDLFLIEGDIGQINQVMINIINNSIDAMRNKGHLVIKTENASDIEIRGVAGLENSNESYVKIVISDTGVGMTQKTLEKVFEPFFSTKAFEGNTGLGLSMVYGTVKNHGGAVIIRSAINQGTSVTLYLPIYKRKSLTIGKALASPLSTTHVKDLSILVIDDEPLVRKSTSRILKQFGFHVLTAQSGKKGVELYKEHKDKIDLVLLDLIMPDMDGEQTFNELLSINPEIKVIFISAFSKDSIRVDNLLERGAIDFVQKPFTLNEISTVIHKTLNK